PAAPTPSRTGYAKRSASGTARLSLRERSERPATALRTVIAERVALSTKDCRGRACMVARPGVRAAADISPTGISAFSKQGHHRPKVARLPRLPCALRRHLSTYFPRLLSWR